MAVVKIKAGDLVFANEDRRRFIHCVGIVTEIREGDPIDGQDERSYARVLWGRPSTPTGWWLFDELEVISEVG